MSWNLNNIHSLLYVQFNTQKMIVYAKTGSVSVVLTVN